MNREKWSVTTSIFCTTGFFLVSMVTSILTKSTCTRSIGSVAEMVHNGTLGSFFSYTLHFLQFCRVIIICILIFGHQNLSCNSEYVLSLPWCPTSRWHRSNAAWCLEAGTTNSSAVSVLPFGVSLINSMSFSRVKSFCWSPYALVLYELTTVSRYSSRVCLSAFLSFLAFLSLLQHFHFNTCCMMGLFSCRLFQSKPVRICLMCFSVIIVVTWTFSSFSNSSCLATGAGLSVSACGIRLNHALSMISFTAFFSTLVSGHAFSFPASSLTILAS